MAEPGYALGQRVGVALLRGSTGLSFEAVITDLPAGASPYYSGTDPTGETVLFVEREIVTTLPPARDVASVEAWLNGR
jgi:hypothetical protein